MSNYLSDIEAYAGNALMGVLIFLSVVLAVAFLAGTSPDMGSRAIAHVQHVAAVTTVQTAS